MDHKTVAEIGPWKIFARENRSGNLTIEINLDDNPHADLICQRDGTMDLGTKARPWPLGEQGWGMPGAPDPNLRKYRFSEANTN